MENIQKIILFLILAAFCASCQEHQDSIQDSPDQIRQQLCYMDVTIGKPVIAGSDTIPGVIDSMLITLTVHGDSVNGIFSWLPGEKDKMTGTLTGTVKDSIVTAVYSCMAEGIEAKEEKIFKIGVDKLWIKTGELFEQNGVWQIKNKESALYIQSVPKTECK